MSHICLKCNDTGSLSKLIDSDLDCHYCDATTRRRALIDTAVKENWGHHLALKDALWAAYLFAQRQAAPVAQPAQQVEAVEEVEQLKARLDAKETRNKMLLAELDALGARYFHGGTPPAHFGKEWFIAVMDDGDKVVLRALEEENAYDYTTMDATYFKAYRVKKWMQFPDSQYITYQGTCAQLEAQQAGDVVRAKDIAFGYQSGCAYSSEIGGSVTLHYQNDEQAEAAFVAITDSIDAAIAQGRKA